MAPRLTRLPRYCTGCLTGDMLAGQYDCAECGEEVTRYRRDDKGQSSNTKVSYNEPPEAVLIWSLMNETRCVFVY